MDFVKDKPACKFSVPDRPTVRQQMEYFSATVGAAGSQLLSRYWEGAKALITEWECEIIPKRDNSLDEMTNPEQAELLIWASMQVKRHMDTLENIPKN